MLYPITAVAQKNSAALIGLHRGAANPGRSRLSAGSPAASQAAAPAASFWLWLCHSAGRAILPAAGFSAAGATTATAHKIAIIFYTMVKKQVEYDATLWAERDAQREKRFEAKLKRQAQQLGYKLVPIEEK